MNAQTHMRVIGVSADYSAASEEPPSSESDDDNTEAGAMSNAAEQNVQLLRLMLEALSDAQVKAAYAETAIKTLGIHGEPTGLLTRVGALEGALIELRKTDAQTRSEMLDQQKATNATLLLLSQQIGNALGGSTFRTVINVVIACSLTAIAVVGVLQLRAG